MNRVSPRSIRMHHDGYCSQMREHHPHPRTIEEGVKIIENILEKRVLCQHDVKDINQAYRTIDILERQIDPIPQYNSEHALKKIIEKVERIACDKDNSADGLISLYHLQQFSDKDLTIDKYFNNLFSKFSKNQETIEAIATDLPYCFSEAQFDEDITFLIGANQSDKITEILNQKKEKLQNHERTKQAITSKKLELEEHRKKDPQNYPAYLDELLDNGYIYLYDHIIQMRDLTSRNNRQSEINKLTFSLLSHIVLETREAVIEKVERSIPADCHNILFILGGSGVGKSTVLCFLRGDEMVLEDFNYKSRSDKDGIIGYDAVASSTFTPNVEIVNGLVVVDFPGFDDTSGQIISMGMEFALKALITKYNPQILVVESITNIEGKFANAAKLGLRLARLIENKQECILGITKYSRDPDYGLLKNIEEAQKKELCTPSVEELVIEGQINALLDVNKPDLQTRIGEFRHKLNAMRNQKEEKQRLPLFETPQKQESRNRLQERERELLKQIGLADIIKFDTLDNPNLLSICFETLAKQKKTARSHPQQVLDHDHEKLLEDRFEKNLKYEIENQKEFIKIKNFQEFEQNVLESSLINTIFQRTNPEIGCFLHSPEMDQRLVRKYDQAIVGNCVDKCIRSTVGNLNVALIQKILNELKGKAPKYPLINLEVKSKRLQKYILGLLGSLPEDPEKANEAWITIQEKQKSAIDAIEKGYALPTWITILLGLPLGIPLGIRTLHKFHYLSKKTTEMTVKLIEDICGELDLIHQTLIRLRDVENIVRKQEQIDKAFNSVVISLKSEKELEETLRRKISAVQNVYGAEDWDKRVKFLQKQLRLFPTSFAMIVPLIDDDITYIEKKKVPVVSLNKISIFGDESLLFIDSVEHPFYLVRKKHDDDELKNSNVPKFIYYPSFRETLSFKNYYRANSPSSFIGRVSTFTEGQINMKNSLFRAMVSDTLFKNFDRVCRKGKDPVI